METHLTIADKRKVLIIEDEIELCELLKHYFIRKEYEVHVSHTLQEGQMMIHNLHPDVILLDNNLPDGTGWSAADQILTESPASFILFISGYHPTLPALPLGTHYGVIEKPISFRNLDQNLATLSSTS